MREKVLLVCSVRECVFLLGQGRLYGGGCFVLQGVVPKVLQKMPEIRCIVVDWIFFVRVGRLGQKVSDGGFL